MKQLKLVALVAVLVAVFALPVLADDVSVVDFGITNTVAAAGESSNVGSAVKVDAQSDGHVGLVARVQGSAAGTEAIGVTIARSPDGTVWETTPTITWTFPKNGTTEVIAYTNLYSGWLGAAHSIKVTAISNGDDAAITNCYIKVVKKKVK